MNGMRRATSRERYAFDQVGVRESTGHREANLDSQGLRSALVVKGVVVAHLANRRVSEPRVDDVKHPADSDRYLRAGNRLLRKSEQQGGDGDDIARGLHGAVSPRDWTRCLTLNYSSAGPTPKEHDVSLENCKLPVLPMTTNRRKISPH